MADPGEERLQTFSRGLGRKTEKFPNRILIGWLGACVLSLFVTHRGGTKIKQGELKGLACNVKVE